MYTSCTECDWRQAAASVAGSRDDKRVVACVVHDRWYSRVAETQVA